MSNVLVVSIAFDEFLDCHGRTPAAFTTDSKQQTEMQARYSKRLCVRVHKWQLLLFQVPSRDCLACCHYACMLLRAGEYIV